MSLIGDVDQQFDRAGALFFREQPHRDQRDEKQPDDADVRQQRANDPSLRFIGNVRPLICDCDAHVHEVAKDFQKKKPKIKPNTPAECMQPETRNSFAFPCGR